MGHLGAGRTHQNVDAVQGLALEQGVVLGQILAVLMKGVQVVGDLVTHLQQRTMELVVDAEMGQYGSYLLLRYF